MNQKGKKIFIAIFLIVLIGFILIKLFGEIMNMGAKKPVIYLYPQEEMEVSVKVDIEEEDFICTYPEHGDGWNVVANPDGTIIDGDGKEYSYLFWEAKSNEKYDMSKGFLVRGKDTATFLQDKLAYLGMMPKEYNEFIVYWLPEMQNNKYNIIHFSTDVYTNNYPLIITPEPDSLLRVFMVFKKANGNEKVEEQLLERFERNGFTVVEWGGTKLK